MTTTPRVHWWISLALLALSGLMLGVFRGADKSLPVIPRSPEDANVLRLAYPQYLIPDPHTRTYPMGPQNQFILSLWEPLVECDPTTGIPQPAAAESWTWSADRKTLTLKLRPDGRWSNGDRVTAHDFVRGWLRLLHQRIEWASTLFPLKNAAQYHQRKITDPALVGIHAVDDLTLRLELDRVRSTLVAELAEPLLAPLHPGSERAFAEYTYFSDPATLVTNGPFQLQRANDNGFRLRACPYYHDHESIRLAGLHFIRVDSMATASLLLAAGMVDVVSPMPYGEARVLPTGRRITNHHERALGVTLLEFNVTRTPLRDVRVRQALALALARSEPIGKFDPDHMVPAWAWVPDMPGRPGLAVLKENADLARRLLAEAGYPGGKGFPVLDMCLGLWIASDPFPPSWAEQWHRELGIKTHLIYEPAPVRAKRMTPAGNYDILYTTMFATVPDAGDLLSGFLDPAEYTASKWVDKELIGLLNEANTKSGEERLALLEKAERRILAAAPAVPVMFEQRQTMLAAEVQGWYADPLARQSLKRCWLDPAANNTANPGPGL